MTLYEILGVPSSAKQSDIESAYGILKKKFQNAGTSPQWQDIQYAYSVLSNEERREAYDLLIGLPSPPIGKRNVCRYCKYPCELQKKERTINWLVAVLILLLVALCLTVLLFNTVPVANTTSDFAAQTSAYSPTPITSSGVDFTPRPSPTLVPTSKPTPKPTPTPTPMWKFKVTATARMDSNNSVGNDWSYYYEVNGSPVGSGFTLYLEDGERIDLYAKCVESDSIPDIGTNAVYVFADKSQFETGFYVEVPVTVKENRGRYSGNTANFTVTFDFAPI